MSFIFPSRGRKQRKNKKIQSSVLFVCLRLKHTLYITDSREREREREKEEK